MGEQKNPRSGFTRTELLVVLGCVCFLGLVWLRPSWANSAARNDEAVCANNLRVIGQAFLQWSHDNGEQNPWWITANYPNLRGWHDSVWLQFWMVSNHLRSPRFLADPADDWANLRVAANWSDQPGGLLHTSAKNNSVSYFLGLRATPFQPQSILSGDTSIYSPDRSSASPGFVAVTRTAPESTYWQDRGHRTKGNLLFNDERVEMTDTPALKKALAWNTNWNRYILEPRIE